MYIIVAGGARFVYNRCGIWDFVYNRCGISDLGGLIFYFEVVIYSTGPLGALKNCRKIDKKQNRYIRSERPYFLKKKSGKSTFWDPNRIESKLGDFGSRNV